MDGESQALMDQPALGTHGARGGQVWAMCWLVNKWLLLLKLRDEQSQLPAGHLALTAGTIHRGPGTSEQQANKAGAGNAKRSQKSAAYIIKGNSGWLYWMDTVQYLRRYVSRMVNLMMLINS